MPGDKHPPAFQFYVDDFIADAAVDAMTNEEVGIYVRFLCKAWKEEPVGTIPSEDRVLMNWAKTTPQIWKRCRESVLSAFTLGEDKRYHQKRMKSEWQKLIDFREARSKGGKKGMANRWHGDNSNITEDSSVNNRHITDTVTKNNPPFPSPSSFPYSNINTGQTGAMNLVFEGEQIERIRDRAKRIQSGTKIDCKKPSNHALIAKVAILWDLDQFADNEIECILESFSKGKIENRVGYFRGAVGKRCTERGTDLNALLDKVEVPAALMPGGVSR